MPHAGHFICAKDCKFHLNTYVGGVIVSTVGEYWPDSQVRKIHAEVAGKHIEGRGDEYDRNYFKEFGWEDIGCGRKYETMVFKATQDKENTCCPWRQSSGSDLDFNSYNDSNAAFAGHMAMCEKWAKKHGKKS